MDEKIVWEILRSNTWSLKSILILICNFVIFSHYFPQVAYDPGNKSKPIAIRIRKLPKGSIKQDQIVSSQTYTGSVIQDQPGKPKKSSPTNNNQRDSDTGLIKYTINGKDSATIVYLVSKIIQLCFMSLNWGFKQIYKIHQNSANICFVIIDQISWRKWN